MNTAKRIVQVVLDDLKGRKGVGNELEEISPDIMKDLEKTLENKVQTVLDKSSKDSTK